MLNTNPETKNKKDKKTKTTRPIVGYTTSFLSSKWRGNVLNIKMKGGKKD